MSINISKMEILDISGSKPLYLILTEQRGSMSASREMRNEKYR